MLKRTGSSGRSHDVGCDAAVCAIETELTVLARSLELVARRADGSPFDRAGYLLVRTLDQEGETTINGLADQLGLDATTVTRQVATLEDAGHVVRRTDAEDRRRSIIGLTPNGRRAMAATRNVRRARTEALVADFSPAERRQLGSLLAKLNTAIQHTHLTPS